MCSKKQRLEEVVEERGRVGAWEREKRCSARAKQPDCPNPEVGTHP
eukprot:COSAG02_NODE_230_length_28060_cov_5.226816_1_plen_45_part_10